MEWRPVAPAAPYYPPQQQQQQYYAPMQVVAPQPYSAAPAQAVFMEPVPVMAPRNGVGTAAGVLGILAVILTFIPYASFIGIVLGILAVIFGGVGISRANRIGGAGKGMAVTGLVLGLIAVVLAVILLIAVYAFIFRTGVAGTV
jgi:hypothetical protein